MLTNGFGGPGREAGLQEIEKLVSSHLLHNSESLCNLLRFLAQKSLDCPGVSVKEYEIATEVFHRSPDFDPRLDSTVRVQTGRLRSKLSEYYAEEPEDTVVVEIPKGSYSLVFHYRTSQEREDRREPPGDAVHLEEPVPSVPAAQTQQRAGVRWPWLLAAVVASVSLTAGVFQVRLHKPAPPGTVVAFWHSFFESGEPPLLIYSNAAFVGRPETGLRYFRESDSQGDIIDHYTGVGEVMGIHELDKLAGALNSTFRVHRGRLMSWDDARNSNILFIGSPAENLSLREMPAPRQFQFQRLLTTERPGDLAIQNLHPRAGEKPFYIAPSARPLNEDYAVIELLPGLTPPHQVLILAGTTTFGTQAAVEYVCRPKKLEELLMQATGSPAASPSPFEAVIHVQISGGVPIQTELVSLHKR